jgi:hypothetical protein
MRLYYYWQRAPRHTTNMIDLPSWRITEPNGLDNFSGHARLVHLDGSNIVGTVQSNHVTKATVSNMTGDEKEAECESMRVMQIDETYIVFGTAEQTIVVRSSQSIKQASYPPTYLFVIPPRPKRTSWSVGSRIGSVPGPEVSTPGPASAAAAKAAAT